MSYTGWCVCVWGGGGSWEQNREAVKKVLNFISIFDHERS